MLSAEAKIGQMCMVGFQGLEAPKYILEWLEAGRIGGVILFSRNIDTPEQVYRLTRSCHEAARHPILIGIDQEGGTVARLYDGFTESPGAMALGASGSEELAYDVSRMLATELRALGINWNYAPVLDLTHDIRNPSVGCRSLGFDKHHVSRLASAQIRGFQDGGTAATAKHFPGLGNTPVDTHDAFAIISDSIETLRENDLVPFRAAVAAGVASIMITHVMFDKLDNQYPATFSPAIVTELLRNELGFTGVVTTDCMEMKAISDHYGAGESAVLAALAGQDLILFSHTREYQESAYEALLNALRSGRLSEARVEESVQRIQAMKARFAASDQPPLDVIRQPEHLKIAKAAAEAGVVMLYAEDDVIPLRAEQARIGVVEFASYLESRVAERREQTRFENMLKEIYPQIETVSLRATEPNPDALAQARRIAAQSDLLIVATRSAHLIPEQLQLASELLGSARRTILLCLRNPYDADVLPHAGTVLCTCGDSTPSIRAAVDALAGKFVPTGQLPVPVQH